MDPHFESEILQLGRLLFEMCKPIHQEFDKAKLLSKMSLFEDAAKPFSIGKPLHVQAYMERLLLDYQFNLCLNSRLCVPDVISEIIGKFELLGFFNTTSWASMSIELAWQLDLAGDKVQAKELRLEIESEMNKLRSECGAISEHCRIMNSKL